MQIQAPKGTKDVLPGESYKWQYIEKEMRDLCRLYGINELRTPIIEHTELFMRGVGDTTDIVQKEMYTFKDKGDRSITLKPEGTSGMVRAFLENRLFNEALPQRCIISTLRFSAMKSRRREGFANIISSALSFSVRPPLKPMRKSSCLRSPF